MLRSFLFAFFSAVVAGLLVSCSPQTLTLSDPSVWKIVPKPDSPRWVVAYPSSHAPALARLKRRRAAQGYKVVSLPDASRQSISAKVTSLHLGRHEGDCLLLVGPTPTAFALHDLMRGRSSDNRYALDRGTTTPLFAVGRFPTRSSAETHALASRILRYEANSHSREAKLLVGNPMGGGQRIRVADMLINRLSKKLLSRMDSSWEVSGAADLPGHPFGSDSQSFQSVSVLKLGMRSALDQTG